MKLGELGPLVIPTDQGDSGCPILVLLLGPLPWMGRRKNLCQGSSLASHLDLGQTTSFFGL